MARTGDECCTKAKAGYGSDPCHFITMTAKNYKDAFDYGVKLSTK